MLDGIKLIGGFLGIIAFVWKLWDAFRSYLNISLGNPILEGSMIAIRVEVQNRSIVPKTIDSAIILFGPQEENPIETARLVAGPKTEICFTNDIVKIETDSPIFAQGGRGIIPLPFFYNEQVKIGNEHLSFKCLIPTNEMASGLAYAIRFFIFTKGRLHRSTHEAIVIPPALPVEQADAVDTANRQ